MVNFVRQGRSGRVDGGWKKRIWGFGGYNSPQGDRQRCGERDDSVAEVGRDGFGSGVQMELSIPLGRELLLVIS